MDLINEDGCLLVHHAQVRLEDSKMERRLDRLSTMGPFGAIAKVGRINNFN